MSARAIGSATISFNYIHEKCGSRVKMQNCPKDDELKPARRASARKMEKNKANASS